MRTWDATTNVLPPAGPEGKHGRFKGKCVNGKIAGQMIKITKFPGKNGRVDRYEPIPSVTAAMFAVRNTGIFTSQNF